LRWLTAEQQFSPALAIASSVSGNILESQQIMKPKIIIILFFISTVLVSCKLNQEITGKYHSNFAQSGFFITEIAFNPDNSFHYEFAGDLSFQELDGKFIIRGNKLYLKFDKLKTEPVELTFADTLDFNSDWQNSHSYELESKNDIEYHLKYRIRGDRLQTYNMTKDRIERRTKFCSDNRLFGIFGPKCYQRKYYLIKRNK